MFFKHESSNTSPKQLKKIEKKLVLGLYLGVPREWMKKKIDPRSCFAFR